MSKSQILYDHQIFQSQKYGGISRYFAEVLPRLAARKDFDVSLFLGRSINEYELENKKNLFLNFRGAKNHNKFSTKLNRLEFPIFSYRCKPDLIHFTYYRDTNPFFKGLRVLTVYDLIHEIFPEQFTEKDPTAIWKRHGISKADLIISISESTKNDLVKHFNFPIDKIKVIPLANSLKVDPGSIRLWDYPYILFVGLRDKYKNFGNVLKSLKIQEKMKDLHLVAFGGPQFTNEENEMIQKLGLSSRVHYDSGQDQKLAQAYKHAEAFVFPSIYEGFGIPPLEAMFYECPVLCSNKSSVPEVVGDAALQVDTQNVDALSEGLSKIVFDSELRKSLKEKGRLREESFSWDRCAEEHAKVYKLML